MPSRRRLFRAFYRIGFTPWDGHPLAGSLRALVEGEGALPAGAALDIGCGTGDNAVYLAEHGWDVTAVDYVDRPLVVARRKAAAKRLRISFIRADATRLSTEGVGSGFRLVVDSGCLHGMNAEDRDAYVREVTAVATAGAHLLIIAFVPGSSFGVPGIAPDEVTTRFATAGWSLLSSGSEKQMDHNGKDPARHYLFERATS